MTSRDERNDSNSRVDESESDNEDSTSIHDLIARAVYGRGSAQADGELSEVAENVDDNDERGGPVGYQGLLWPS